MVRKQCVGQSTLQVERDMRRPCEVPEGALSDRDAAECGELKSRKTAVINAYASPGRWRVAGAL